MDSKAWKSGLQTALSTTKKTPKGVYCFRLEISSKINTNVTAHPEICYKSFLKCYKQKNKCYKMFFGSI